MKILLGIIILIFSICLIIGLKNPLSITIWEDEFRTKKNVLKYCGIPLVIATLLFSAISINSYYEVKRSQERLQKEIDDKLQVIQKKQNSYIVILDTDKTYEQMNDFERKDADAFLNYEGWDYFEQSFKDKYQSKKEDMQASHDKYYKDKKEADEKAKAKLKAEEEVKKAKEEKIGYDTGITYDQLARTPNDYKSKKAKFTGKVLQVVEGKGETDLRIAVNGNYDNVLYVVYSTSIINSRVLENDNVTVKGTSQGIYSYKSTLGKSISVPLLKVDSIVINK